MPGGVLNSFLKLMPSCKCTCTVFVSLCGAHCGVIWWCSGLVLQLE